MQKRYPWHAFAGMGLSAVLFISFSIYPIIKEWYDSRHKSDEPISVKTTRVINYSELSAPPPIDLEREEPKIFEAPPKIKTVKFLQPVAKQDEEVIDEEDIPTMEEMEQTQIGTENQDGIDSVVVDVNFVVDLPPAEPKKEQVYKFVSIMPKYALGEEGLAEYLSQHIKYPRSAFESGIEGTVYVEFVIEKDGEVTGVTIARSVHPLLDNEAARVVADMPNWIPGEQNNQKVRVSFVLPIRFKLAQQ